MIKSIRAQQMSEWKSAGGAAMWVANHFGTISRVVRALDPESGKLLSTVAVSKV
jgi:hypothetical protein